MHPIGEQEGEIKRGGITLFYTAVTPPDPKAVLIIVHGLSEHRGRYLKLQRELARSRDGAAAPLASWAYDQRGFGTSTGRRTYVDDYHEFLEDLQAVIAAVRRATPRGTPLFLIGHSLGGAVVASYCIDAPGDVDGVILSSPAYQFYPPPAVIHFLGVTLNRLCPKQLIRYPGNAEHLSHDPEIGRAFRADPLVQSAATPRFYHEFQRMTGALRQQADRITLPVLILQGTADILVVPEGAKAFHEKIRSEKKRLIFYEGFYHELFNEIGREKVITDMVAWLNELLSG